MLTGSIIVFNYIEGYEASMYFIRDGGEPLYNLGGVKDKYSYKNLLAEIANKNSEKS